MINGIAGPGTLECEQAGVRSLMAIWTARLNPSWRHFMPKSTMMIIGVILVVLGVVGLMWQKISVTTKETVVDAGPIKITADREKEVPVPPILGGVALAGGVGLLVMSAKKR